MVKHKNNKKRKPSNPKQLGGYKRFITELTKVVSKVFTGNSSMPMSAAFKKMMYETKLTIRNAEPYNDKVSSKECKVITEKFRHYYKTEVYEIPGKISTLYEMHLLYSYVNARAYEFKKKAGENDPDVISYKKSASDVFRVFFQYYYLSFLRTVLQFSSPDKKYFSVDIRISHAIKSNTKAEIVADLYGYDPIKKYFEINGIKRPAYKLRSPLAQKPFIKDITFLNTQLHLNTSKENYTLDVYIQSHALKRIHERLDNLDTRAIHHSLWTTINQKVEFILHKGYKLLPFLLNEVKVGYLLATIVDHTVVFRTFLFITHNSTPEGDMLRRQTGLAKEDMKYWKIDRLSTFLNLDPDKQPGLFELFKKAGLGDLIHLRSMKFDIDSLQIASIDGLLDYLTQT